MFPAGTRYFKKGCGHIFQGRRKVFGFIKGCKTELTIENMCKVLQVSSSSSNRDVQYTRNKFTEQLKKHPVQQSISRKGNCWDNSVAENFFKTLKTEMIYPHDFKIKAAAKLAIFKYSEV